MTSLSEKQWRVTFLTLRDCARVCVSFSSPLAKDVEASGWFVTIWEAVSSHARWKLRPKLAEERRRTVLLTKRFEASDSHFPRLLHNLFIALLFNYGLLFQAGLSQEALPEEQEGKKEVETERGRERERSWGWKMLAQTTGLESIWRRNRCAQWSVAADTRAKRVLGWCEFPVMVLKCLCRGWEGDVKPVMHVDKKLEPF